MIEKNLAAQAGYSFHEHSVVCKPIFNKQFKLDINSMLALTKALMGTAVKANNFSGVVSEKIY